MKGYLRIDCDHCLNDIEIDLAGKGLKEILVVKEVRNELHKQGWHHLKRCLCPECKNKVGEKNCLNCATVHYNDFNWRCQKDHSIVSEYDTCSAWISKKSEETPK